MRLDEPDRKRIAYLRTRTGIRGLSELIRFALTRLEDAERARDAARKED